MLLSPYRTTVVPLSDAGVSEKLLDLLFGQDVPGEAVVQLGGPVPADCAGDVSLGVCFGVDVDLDQRDVGVSEVVLDPLGCNDGSGCATDSDIFHLSYFGTGWCQTRVRVGYPVRGAPPQNAT